MYKVYSDNNLLLDVNIPGLMLYTAALRLELNKAGTFVFTIYPEHPCFNKIEKLKSVIKVYKDDKLFFCGRVLNDVQGFYNEKQITCEGELAYLVDSIQRPYDFLSGDKHTTIPEFFAFLINNHNSQVNAEHRFKVGNVTVTDSNNYIVRESEGYSDTWTAINAKLIDLCGGYIWTRHEADGVYIDYLADFSELGSQPVEFGKNLLDLDKTINGEDIATVIIPLGAADEETREKVTIKSVNDNKDYIENAAGIAKYGRICKVVEWEDITLPSNLLAAAQRYITTAANLNVTVEISAFDLAATGADFESFKLGQYISVYSSQHDLQANYLVRKLTIDLLQPQNNQLTIGTTYSTFTEQTTSNKIGVIQATAAAATAENTATIAAAEAVAIKADLAQNYLTAAATRTEISSQVTASAYTKAQIDGKLDDIEALIPADLTVISVTLVDNVVTGGTIADCDNIKLALAAGNYKQALLVTYNGDKVLCPFACKVQQTESGTGVDYVFTGRYWNESAAALNTIKIGFNETDSVYSWFGAEI